jgi:2-keto-4-pentenoate hydratase/2-oxohepta-3-ene-1,7-dioic acid hydratase in catechol pathway
MKLATLKNGARDGKLVVVSRDLTRFTDASFLVPNLQAALDDWRRIAPHLATLAESLETGSVPSSRFHEHDAHSPLPRAYQWADGSAYLNHVELVRKSRGSEMPPNFETEPLIYQGGSDTFLAPRAVIRVADEGWGADLEGEIAVIVDDVPMGASAEEARDAIRLVMLVNDVSLRGLAASELAKGFGFFQSKPSSAPRRSQRQATRQGERRRDAFRFRAVDRPRGEDQAAGRRHDRRVGHCIEQARWRIRQVGVGRRGRLFLPGGTAHRRKNGGRRGEDAIPALR